MTSVDPKTWLAELAAVFTRERDHLGSLDALVGDGDHGASMERGFAKAHDAVAEIDAEAGALLSVAGRAFMKGVGGASGPLFASLLLELGKSATERGSLDLEAILQGSRNAAVKIQRLGRGAVGEKTMLDALVPAFEALSAAAQKNEDLPQALALAAQAATDGAAATTAMPARQGRGRYIEGQGVGQPDPGATSMALVFQALSDVGQQART